MEGYVKGIVDYLASWQLEHHEAEAEEPK